MAGAVKTEVRAIVVRGLLSAAILLFPALKSAAQTSSNDNLEKAISFLRQIDPDKVKPDDEEKVATQIDEAWDTIKKAGAPGKTRLKLEIARPGQTDYFRLNGAALLWELGGLDEAEAIASVWRATRLEVQSNYVFYPAFQAAQQQDPRALPMLRAVLGNNKFRIYVGQHAMDVRWPLTLDFIWGAYGPKALPVLQNVIDSSADEIELQSTLLLLARSQYLPAYPRIRTIASSKTGAVKLSAITSLGVFGQPQDFEFLLAGLRSKEPLEVWSHVYALYEFEDLRAVPDLIPLLQSQNQMVRLEVISALRHLMTPASLAALRKYSAEARDTGEKERVSRIVTLFFEQTGTTAQAYEAKSSVEKETLVASYRQQFEDENRLKSTEQPKTHAQFSSEALQWKEKGRLEDANRKPLAVRQILSGATADDIDLLIEVRARLYRRLSDECLYEVGRIDQALKHLGRSRYRKVTGTTMKVEPI
jgi:HEAT repeat protein